MYVALVNVPGYLGTDDEPPTFETPGEAWGYLAEERQESDDAWVPVDAEDPDGPQQLDETCVLLERYERENHGEGSVWGPTAGYAGDHDLGMAYSVMVAEEG